MARSRSALASGLLVVLGCLVSLGLVEAGLRAVLYVTHAKRFRLPQRMGYFAAYNTSHWEFDREFGYVYPPGRVIGYTGVRDGKVADCARIAVINRAGNIGPVVGDYHTAEVKVLVFGDSWTAFHQKDAAGRERTWTHVLQEVLEKRLGKRVHVVNFGRDGYGILQMFDLAAAKVSEWKPDLVVFAFISDDLARGRFWRTVVGAGDGLRVLTTTEAVPNPDVERAADTFLLMPSATYEWCTRRQGRGGTDPVLAALIEKHRRLLAHIRPRGPANVFTTRHSYLYNLIVAGDPFHFAWRDMPPSVLPRVAFDSFARDPRFLGDVDRVRRAGRPFVVFHFAIYPELRAGREFVLDHRQATLLASLEAATGSRVLRTTDYVEMPVRQTERLNVSPDDYHPSLQGMDFYARAVSEALVRERLLAAAKPETGASRPDSR